jgi:ATP-dependent DNA helicase
LNLGLPPKKEYVLYAPLSERQKSIYEVIVGGRLRRYLIGKTKDGMDAETEEAQRRINIDVDQPRKLRGGKARKSVGDLDGDDDEYFQMLEKGFENETREKERTAEDVGREWQRQATCEFFSIIPWCAVY